MSDYENVRPGGVYRERDGGEWVAIHRHVDFGNEAKMARPSWISPGTVFNDVDDWAVNANFVQDWEYVRVSTLTDTGRTWGKFGVADDLTVQISSVKAALAALGIEADVVAVAQAIDNALAEVAA